MKRFFSFNMLLVLLLICSGCGNQENNGILNAFGGADQVKDTQFVLDTVATLSADCTKETLSRAFDECRAYEKLLSCTDKESELYRLNQDGTATVSEHTLKVIEKGIYYGDLSGGKFDISIRPVSVLWDFKNQVVPSRDEIASALKSVDYEGIETNGNEVRLGGRQLDLGGIAKGYIADRLVEFLKTEGALCGSVNLGGNVVVFGEKEVTVGIRSPEDENKLSATLKLSEKSVVTAGTYERSFTKDGVFYHHILDTKTGYGVESDLVSATVIGDSSMDCDALATICILSGKSAAAALIESFGGFEAVFIETDGKITCTSGLSAKSKLFSGGLKVFSIKK